MDVRLVKKYPNRRLYDTELSRYITLKEVEALVVEQVPFVVVDHRSEEDVTAATLLQVLVSLQISNANAVSCEFLLAGIRAFSRPQENVQLRAAEETPLCQAA